MLHEAMAVVTLIDGWGSNTRHIPGTKECAWPGRSGWEDVAGNGLSYEADPVCTGRVSKYVNEGISVSSWEGGKD